MIKKNCCFVEPVINIAMTVIAGLISLGIVFPALLSGWA